MAVPTYDELSARVGVDKRKMEQTVQESHLTELSFKLDQWEMLALTLEISAPDIDGIKSQGSADVQRARMLQRWKQRCGSRAKYETLTRALLKINRTDLAEIVVSLCQSITDNNVQVAPINQTSTGTESTLATPPSPASSSGVEDMSPISPTSWITATSVQPAVDIAPTLQQLEEDFCELVTEVELILDKNDVGLNTITRRFSMLPQSVKRRYQTDRNYKVTKRKILESTTIKTLFDNLTDLKHWNYMMPDTLAHILKNVKIDDIHQKIDKYKEKLLNFKMRTKLGDLIGTRLPVPDYCIELTMEVEGWEGKTIEEAEKAVGNIMRCAAYGHHLPLGWKGVEPGSMKLTLILLESIKITSNVSLDAICTKYTGVINIELDGDLLYYTDGNNELKDEATGTSELVPERLWYKTGTTVYAVGGGRDVLIISAGLPPHQPEAVARRPGQLTEEDKQKLLRQGVTSDCRSEVDIVRARYELDKSCKIVDVMSEHSLARKDVLKNITNLLNTTKNDGVLLYYIGAGRRSTGDWCFEDGFITFRDIAQLYLHSKLRGRILTIVSDCSYSGRWVRDCMEFLDEQGVQPCGHKAREKGILIKIIASCKSYQIPTEYRHLVSGAYNDKNSGGIRFRRFKQLLETQTMYHIDPSELQCSNNTITEPCTLQPGYTWRKEEEGRRVYLVRGKDRGRPVWHYVLVVDDEDTLDNFKEKVKSGRFDVADYGRVLHSGWGKDPPTDIRERIKDEYG